ncbi:MAG: adenosylcobinamide-GDP ribazoletransferase [bacterium]|nr:adenosylcobinamide-GDP ribazoletransferase [bacterium]
MTVIKSFFIAFSIYSKIPVPQFAWREEDMKYMMCFFPWIGGVIGLVLYGWGVLCRQLEIGSLCTTLMYGAIPLAVSGGFHVDGFLDTMDAFHSYQSRERKLEILKDSHVGAFAVIMFAFYGLVYLAAFSEIKDLRLLGIVGAGFFLARGLSGIAVFTFPKAKKEGMVNTFQESGKRKTVTVILFLQCIACVVFMIGRDRVSGGWIVLVALLSFAYYYWKTRKELGGITGDTAGYFVVICEGCMVVTAAVIQILLL